MKTIEYRIHTEIELAAAYMYFIRQGALFIKTAATSFHLGEVVNLSIQLPHETTPLIFMGKVIWITLGHEQNQLPEGIGIQFPEENSEQLTEKIRQLLPKSFDEDFKSDTL